MGNIRVCEFQSESVEEAKLIDWGHLNLDSTSHLGAFTSLTYDIFLKTLVIGTDAGDIIIWDMQAEKEVTRTSVDVCGIQEVQFQHSHALMILGKSTQSPIQVFDIRNCHQEALYPTLKSQPSHYPWLTSMCPHHARDEVLVGTSKGDVLRWDLRASISDTYHLHDAKGESRCYYERLNNYFIVTALKYNYQRTGSVFSTSTDGSLKISELSSGGVTSSALAQESSASMSCLDYDIDSGSLLAGSNLGRLHLRKLKEW